VLRPNLLLGRRGVTRSVDNRHALRTHLRHPRQRYREVGGIQFVNTGSAGRPKDGDWRAGYVLLELDASGARVEFVRVTYDVERTSRAIRESDLPDDFAEYRLTGGNIGVGSPPLRA
jgi:diadenosine tetraphosphatase ApaH/serine/threonine PP2A family protein phosphatase